MKPISVRFKCFGPYMEEQTVDFEKLSNNGIFLICGETGSGKTTILDAICYALFGKSSGGLRQGIEVMRCKSAKKADKTIVEYIFECNGNRYRFHRELRYGTKNLIEEDGCEILQNDEFVPIFQNPKATVVNKKAEEILGLTYDQFCQVVMLPQGKFERLLVSNSEEKEKILTSLFHADKWNEIVLGVKAKVEEETKRLEKELADIQSQLRVCGCTSVDGLKEKLTALEEELVSLTTAVQEAEHSKQQAAKAYEEAIKDNEIFTALESYRKKLYALKQQTEEYARRQKALQLSEAADAIRGIHEAYSAAKDTADKAEADLKSAVSALSTAEESDRAAKKEKEQHDEGRASYDSDKETLMRLKDARDLYASIGEKKKAVEAFAKEEKEKETAAEATKQAYDAARDQWEKAKAENDAAVSAYQEISKKYTANIAGNLASKLKDGAACPVCGSTHHPAPAELTEGVSISEDDVETANQAINTTSATLSAAKSAMDDAQVESKQADDAFTASQQETAAAKVEYEVSLKNIIEGIKSTVELLLRSDIAKSRKKELRKLMVFFAEVDTLDLYNIDWRMQYNRNNQTYQMLIAICYLVVKGLLQTQTAGETKLMDFFDEQRMCRLYEKFILEYYRKHHPGIKANPSQIPWQLDNGISDMLPVMQTDIMLSQGDRVLIIDAKYYGHTTQQQFGINTLHSGNLYQIFTYVKNKEHELASKAHEVAGMLLYAKTDELVLPNNEYQMSGNRIIVRTLNLDCSFNEITNQLDGIASSFFYAKA